MTVKTSSIPSATISPPATTLSHPNNLRILTPPSVILPQSLCMFALPGMAFLAKAAGLAPSVGLGSMSPPQRALPQLRFIKWPTLPTIQLLPGSFFIAPDVTYLFTVCLHPIRRSLKAGILFNAVSPCLECAWNTDAAPYVLHE